MPQKAQIGDGRTGSSGLNAGRGAGAHGAYGKGGSSPSSRVPKKAKPKNLYHGSAKPIRVGDTVKSSRKTGPSATSKRTFAQSYAEGRAKISPRSIEGIKPRVYKVKPVSKAVKNPKFSGRKADEWNDKAGFRVVKEVKPKNVAKKPLVKGQKASGARYSAQAKKRGK